MNKSHLVEALLARFEGNRRQAAHALDAVLDTITRHVAKGEKVTITGFGSFEKIVRNARWVRNPQTGDRVKTKRKAVPKFTAGADLKNVVSGATKLPTLKKAAAATKSGPAKAAAVRKATPAKKTTAKKSAPAKTTAAKKSTTTKTTAKKSARARTTSTTATKKTAAKKTTAKTTAAKKTPSTKAPPSEAARPPRAAVPPGPYTLPPPPPGREMSPPPSR